MKNSHAFLLIAILCSCGPALAQVPFQTIVGEEAQSYQEQVYKSVATSDGGVMAAIWNGDDRYITKLDDDGQPLWSFSYTMDATDSSPRLPDMLATNDGGAYVVVDLVTHISGSNYVLLFTLVRVDAEGTILWSKRYTSTEGDDYLFSCSMALLQNNDLQLTWYGSSASGGPDHSYRINANGDLLWARRQSQGSSFGTSYHDIRVESDNGLVIMHAGHGGGMYPIYLTRWTADGTLLWNKRMRMTNANWEYYIATLLLSASGDCYVHGRQFAPTIQPNNYPYLLKVDPNGSLEWYRLYGSGNSWVYDDEHSAVELPNTDIRFGALGRMTFTANGDYVSATRLLPPVWTSGSYSYSFTLNAVLESNDRTLVPGLLRRVDNVFSTTWTTPFLARMDLTEPLGCGWTEEPQALMTDTIVPSDFIDYQDGTPWIALDVSEADTTVFAIPVAVPTFDPYCAIAMDIAPEHTNVTALSISPNSTIAGSTVNVVVPAAGQLLMIDPAGRVVRSVPITNARTIALATDNLSAAVYLLRLVRNDGIPALAARLIVE